MAMMDAKAAGAALLGFWGALCREPADCARLPAVTEDTRAETSARVSPPLIPLDPI
jgi:hypothetical protein